MVKINQLLFIGLLLCLVTTFTQAAQIFYVDADALNDPGTGTSEDPFRRIQDAINQAVSGDTVEVRPGVYTGSGNYDLDPAGKSITIRGIDPDNPDVIARTIIDPQQQGRGFYIQNGEGANCIIAGLTIRNAMVIIDYDGAGIYCYSSHPTIRNCVIRDSSTHEGSGGGICMTYSAATIINCTITGNFANYYGGGISCISSSPLIANCTISNNIAVLEGGGIDSGESEPDIFNCIIIANTAPLGGGLNCYYPGLVSIVNCTVAANTADDAGGGIHIWYQGSAVVKNSIFRANSAISGSQLGLDKKGTAIVTYGDVQGGQPEVYDPCGLLAWGIGNIDIDPGFASFDQTGDPNLWDFHLKSADGRWDSKAAPAVDLTQNGFVDLLDFALFSSQWYQEGIGLTADLDDNGMVDFPDLHIMLNSYLSEQPLGIWVRDDTSSPCLDAGDLYLDWSAEPWPNGKRINLGAFGGTAQASKSGNISDFNIDGTVNFIDFAQCAGLWNEQYTGIEDLNEDGFIDLSDVEIVAENWLWEKQ